MKNVVIFSDGTGQRGGALFDERRSNIYKLFRATRCGPDSAVDPAEQLAFYDPGLGTAPPGHEGSGLFGTLMRRFFNMVSQATGLGITRNIIDCYAAIIRLWQTGDRIFLFGFSRGAYTMRCLSTVLTLCGVPTRNKDPVPLRRNESTTHQIAAEAVKHVYQHTESRKTFKTARQHELSLQRDELARRFRTKYGSNDPANASKANVYPHFIGLFDTVASLAKPIVATLLFLGAVLLLALPSWALLVWLDIHLRFWPYLAMFAVASAFTSFLLLLGTMIRFEFGLPVNKNWRPLHLIKMHIEQYETDLSNDVYRARHAISIDECRSKFPKVPWGGSYYNNPDPEGFIQLWFAGNHSDVGGSYAENESRLSDISLQWMVNEAVKAGLKHDPTFLKLYPDPTGPQHDETKSSKIRWSKKLRAVPNDAILHPSVRERFLAAAILDYDTMKPYRPENLRNHDMVKDFYLQ